LSGCFDSASRSRFAGSLGCAQHDRLGRMWLVPRGGGPEWHVVRLLECASIYAIVSSSQLEHLRRGARERPPRFLQCTVDCFGDDLNDSLRRRVKRCVINVQLNLVSARPLRHESLRFRSDHAIPQRYQKP